MFALRRARLGVHHHIGGHNFANTFFDGVAKLMDLFETGGASHAYRGIDEMTIPGAAHAHAIAIPDTFPAGPPRRRALAAGFRGRNPREREGGPCQAAPQPTE